MTQKGTEEPPAIKSESLEIIAKAMNKEEVLFSVSVSTDEHKQVKASIKLASPDQYGRDLLSFWNIEYGSFRKDEIHSRFSKITRNMTKYLKNNRDQSLLMSCGQFDDKIGQLLSSLRALNEYNILPDIARRPIEPLPFAEMKPNGEAVGEVIHALQSRDFLKLELDPRHYFGESVYPIFFRKQYRGYQRWNRYFRSRPPMRSRAYYKHHPQAVEKALENITRELVMGIQPIDGIDTELDPTTGKRFVVFKAEAARFYPEEVSDGTIKWLCILVSIYVPASRIFLLEEPENFLHPWMQQRLITTMRQQARATKTIYLLTTHSATVLNSALPKEVVIVTPGSKGTLVSKIQNREEIEKVLQESKFGLGDLWTSGAISGVPTYE
ncbi:MAG: AAA family ATPase [Thermodesulfobacteriota bacterium]